MTHFQIHWRGCPHRRLPQIRIASYRSNSPRGQSRAHAAAMNVLRRPLSATLEAERERQRLRVKKARRVSRESWSAIAQRRKRATWRARQNIQAFGWNSSRDQRDREESSRNHAERSILVDRSEVTVEAKTMLSTDGAASSRCCPPRKRRNGAYSMMHVKEVPVLWRKITYNKDGTIHGEAAKRQGGEYAHVGPLEDSLSRKPRHPLPSGVVYRRGANPAAQKRGDTKHGPIHPYLGHNDISRNLSIISKALSNSTRKPVDLANPSFLESVSRTMIAKNEKLKAIVPSNDGSSDLPSRTPSEKKALRRFEAELNRYAKNPEVPMSNSIVPLTAPSTISARTVAELVPYQAEFQAAGLAVTSAEQRPSRKNKRVVSPPPPPTPPKDEKYQSKATTHKGTIKPVTQDKSTRRRASYESISSINTTLTAPTTIVDFTPTRTGPKEKRSTLLKHRKDVERTVPMQQIKKPIPWLKRVDKGQNNLSSAAGERHDLDTPVRATVNPLAPPEPTNASKEQRQRQLQAANQERSSRIRSYLETRPYYGSSSNAFKHTAQLQGQRKDFKMTTVQPVTVFEDSGSVRRLVRAVSHGYTSDTTLEPVLCENCHNRIAEGSPLLHSSLEISQNSRKTVLSCQQCSRSVSRTQSLTTAVPGEITLRSYIEHKESDNLDRSVQEPITPPPEPTRAPPTVPPDVPPRPQKRNLPGNVQVEPYDNDNPSVFEKEFDEVSKGFSTPELSRSISPVLKTTSSPFAPPQNPKSVKTPQTTSDLEESSPTALSEASDASTVSEIIRCYTSVPKFPYPSSRHQQAEYQLEIRPDELPGEIHIHHAYQRQKFKDSDVFKGLQVATAAAKNVAVDDYINDTCGIDVRRFLVDLKAFDGIGVNELSGRARRTAKKRRETHIAKNEPGEQSLQEDKQDAVLENRKDGKRDLMHRVEKAVDESIHRRSNRGSDLKMGFVAADEAELENAVRKEKGKGRAERRDSEVEEEKKADRVRRKDRLLAKAKDWPRGHEKSASA